MAAAWLLLLCATTLLTSGTLYGEAVALGGVRAAIADVPAADRSLVVQTADRPVAASELDAAVRTELGRVLAWTGGEIVAMTWCACHGPEAKGTQVLGAPNLTDKTWLYGGGEPTVVETITNGRNGHMPAWKDILGPAKIHLLTAYVYSLSRQ